MKTDVILDAQDHISDDAISASATRLIPAGALLMVVRGMILVHSFPTALAAVPLTINQDMKAVVPFRNDLARMLLIVTQGMASQVLKLVSRSTHGTCKLLTHDLFGLALPVPPLPEQTRIVTKVDELMALCDRLEAAQAERERRRDRLAVASLSRLNEASTASASREHVRFHLNHLSQLTTRREHIKELRQTILNFGMIGRLSLQDAMDEPATALLDRIRSDEPGSDESLTRLQERQGKEGPIGHVPAGWARTTLRSVFRVITDGDHLAPPRAADGVPFLTIGNITTGRLDFSNCRFVPQEY